MKYKVGDKVEMKTWEEIKGTSSGWNPAFEAYMKIDFIKIFPDRIVEIIKVDDEWSIYSIKNDNWSWKDYYIKGLAKEPKHEPIRSRFEILDI